jgi:hypothetical protein
MIASNYRKHPEALAVQLCLDFGSLLRWATARPGARVLRAIRVARAKAMQAREVVPPWCPPICIAPKETAPAWAKQAAHRARELARQITAACMTL